MNKKEIYDRFYKYLALIRILKNGKGPKSFLTSKNPIERVVAREILEEENQKDNENL